MQVLEKQQITQEVIDSSLTLEEFTVLTDNLLAEGKTTDDVNTEAMLNYTKISLQRLKRIGKKGQIFPEFEEAIKSNSRKMIWMVLNEGWCGDGSQILPYMFHMAELAGNIEVRVLLRDQNPVIMDAHLTDGKRTIPKLIVLDADTLKEIGSWGSRPKEAKKLFEVLKADESLTGKERQAQLHLWYTKNKGFEIQKELVEMLGSIS